MQPWGWFSHKSLQGHVAQLDATFPQIVKALLGLHFSQAHGKVRRSHLLFEHPFQAAGPARTMKLKTVLPVVVQGTEERNSLNVVPMKMGDENVGGNRTAIELAAEGMSQHAEARATVEDVEVVTEAHLHAGSVASVTHILRLGSGRRSANSPELNTHKPS